MNILAADIQTGNLFVTGWDSFNLPTELVAAIQNGPRRKIVYSDKLLVAKLLAAKLLVANLLMAKLLMAKSGSAPFSFF